MAYYAVPMSGSAISAFRHHMIERWHGALMCRSQRRRLTWMRKPTNQASFSSSEVPVLGAEIITFRLAPDTLVSEIADPRIAVCHPVSELCPTRSRPTTKSSNSDT